MRERPVPTAHSHRRPGRGSVRTPPGPPTRPVAAFAGVETTLGPSVAGLSDCEPT